MASVEDPGGDEPASQLDEWLDELHAISETMSACSSPESHAQKQMELAAPRIDTYRFSLMILEDTQDSDLDAILAAVAKENNVHSNQRIPQRQECEVKACHMSRTDSPDNDSAFSDTVSMMSTESSASSSSSKCKTVNAVALPTPKIDQPKADKIKLALEKIKEANVKKIFIKAFTVDGSSKSLLIDERMSCAHVTRLLADKNHVTLEPKWAVIEHLTDLHMERAYEEHEIVVSNLLLWTRESKNKILFEERPNKLLLFQTPEKFLLTEDDPGYSATHDEHSRQVILDEFFGQNGGTASAVPSVSGHPVPAMEGMLYLKSETKKGWKKYHFVVRPSGLYYSPKEKAKTLKELVCLATFDTNEVYVGINWKKKYKSPTDYGFAIKHPKLQQPKSVKFIKFLCADDQQTMQKWLVAMRIAKYGRQLLDSHRSLVVELAQEDLDKLANARSCSVASIPAKSSGNTTTSTITNPTQAAPVNSSASVISSEASSICGRHSRASSSSSSGCMSDGGAASESGFDSEFSTGTIKRKPSMKPNIPLTWMTRQLKEMAEDLEFPAAQQYEAAVGDTGTLTRKPRNQPKDAASKKQAPMDKPECSTFNKSSSIRSSSSPARQSNGAMYYDNLVNREPIFGKSIETNKSPYGFSKMLEATQKKKINSAGKMEDFPLPPPPDMPLDVTDIMFSSTLSLDSLPPPPPPELQEDMTGSQLSLPPPPPEAGPGHVQNIASQLSNQRLEQTSRGRPPVRSAADAPRSTFTRQSSLESVSSTSSAATEKTLTPQTAVYGACLQEMQAKKLNPAPPVYKKPILDQNKVERASSIKKQVNFADDLTSCGDSVSSKKSKKITFVLPGNEEPPPLSPRKPVPPKRNESTKLTTSPKKLSESACNPPIHFLEDLQRVMNKKWQVAEKCKLDATTTPHEVLGFREYPLAEEFKVASVSNWVDVHYGDNDLDPRYENVTGYTNGNGHDTSGGYATPANLDNAKVVLRREEAARSGRRPPPPPPRRADSTQLSARHA